MVEPNMIEVNQFARPGTTYSKVDRPVTPLTSERKFYILAVDTLVDCEAYDGSDDSGVKAYSVILIDESGAHEVDRAYRSVSEALYCWPEAIPPTEERP